MRLGFSVRVYGCPDLPSHDARPWHQGPHLSVSLAYLGDILRYLQHNDIHMYRMHSRLLPYPSPPACGDFHGRLDDCLPQLRLIGDLARGADVRLSLHPSSILVLNTPNEEQLAVSLAYLGAQVALMDAMELGPESVIVLHVGGVYGDATAARDRFCSRYDTLSERIRRRLVLENDDRRFSHADVRLIHERCGVPLVLDNLHHLVLNPQGIPMREALAYALRTWPEGITPKIHFSTPRTEMRPHRNPSQLKVPTWTEHSDLVNPFEFIAFIEMARDLGHFDVMLEAKARDLALLKLREDVAHFAPALAGHMI